MLLCAHRSVQEELDRLSQSQSAASVHDRVNKLATRLLDAERTRDELAHKVEECVCPRCKHVLLSPSDRMRACVSARARVRGCVACPPSLQMAKPRIVYLYLPAVLRRNKSSHKP